jgi:undecaprenyl-diphosphatase
MSWNTSLFIAIYRLARVSTLRDRIMLFCAKWLIWILGILTVGFFLLLGTVEMAVWFTLLAATLVCGFITSFMSAFFCHVTRPYVNTKKITPLFTPMYAWKTFPSDHTMVATILTGTLFLASVSPMIVTSFALCTLLIGFSRVYSGVHYPLDIVGGLFFGAMATAFVAQFLA